MDKYLVVKVPDADHRYPAEMTFMGQTKLISRPVISHIGEAVRLASEQHFIGASWLVTHGNVITQEESETIARIFERVAARAKKKPPSFH